MSDVMDFPIKVTLKKPIKVTDDTEITEIIFREPDGSDCLAFGRVEADVDKSRVFFERLGNCKADVLTKLRWDDFATCEEVANRFFGVYQSISGFSLTSLLSSPSILEAVSEMLRSGQSPRSGT